MQRIRNAVDAKLMEEQAGFRVGRSLTEQTFNLGNIVEQYKTHAYIFNGSQSLLSSIIIKHINKNSMPGGGHVPICH